MDLRPRSGSLPPLFHVEQRLTWKATEAYDGGTSESAYVPV